MRSPWGCTVWWAAGAGRGLGLTVILVEGSHVPGSVPPAAVVVCGGRMTGRLEIGMLTRNFDGVMLGGRLCGGGSRWWEGGMGCCRSGVLVWVRVWVRAVSLWLALLRLWCCVRSFFDAWRFPAGFHSVSTLFHCRVGSDNA